MSDAIRNDPSSGSSGERRAPRADARRNLDGLLEAAKVAFETFGVDAPVREIAERAGVGIGTVYRHFPQRADLVAAVFRREIDGCADAAASLAAGCEADEALARWLQHYVGFVVTKRGLAPALHSGDPAYEGLRDHFSRRLKPALQQLLDAAVAAGSVRSDIEAEDLRQAVTGLCLPHKDEEHARRMVALLVDGLRSRPERAVETKRR